MNPRDRMGWPSRYHQAVGLIIAVQEDRFRMVEPKGQGLLFALASNSRVSKRNLESWMRNEVKVRVEYEGESNLESGIAHRVAPLTNEEKGSRRKEWAA